MFPSTAKTNDELMAMMDLPLSWLVTQDEVKLTLRAALACAESMAKDGRSSLSIRGPDGSIVVTLGQIGELWTLADAA